MGCSQSSRPVSPVEQLPVRVDNERVILFEKKYLDDAQNIFESSRYSNGDISSNFRKAFAMMIKASLSVRCDISLKRPYYPNEVENAKRTVDLLLKSLAGIILDPSKFHSTMALVNAINGMIMLLHSVINNVSLDDEKVEWCQGVESVRLELMKHVTALDADVIGTPKLWKSEMICDSLLMVELARLKFAAIAMPDMLVAQNALQSAGKLILNSNGAESAKSLERGGLPFTLSVAQVGVNHPHMQGLMSAHELLSLFGEIESYLQVVIAGEQSPKCLRYLSDVLSGGTQSGRHLKANNEDSGIDVFEIKKVLQLAYARAVRGV